METPWGCMNKLINCQGSPRFSVGIPKFGNVLKTLTVDAENRIWSVGEHSVVYQSLDGKAVLGGRYPGMEYGFDVPLREQPYSPLTNDQGDLLIPLSRQTLRFNSLAGEVISPRCGP